MADNPTVSNTPLSNNPDIHVRCTSLTGTNANQVVQHMRLDVGTGSAESQVTAANPLPVTAYAPMVTFTHTRPAVANNTSTVLIAANSSRKPGSYMVNNTSTTFYLDYGVPAVLNQGAMFNPGDTFLFNTTQEIRGIQNSGGSLNPDIFEAA